MKKIAVILSIIAAATALVILMLSVASAAPSAPAQKVTFTKTTSNPTPSVDDIFTFTVNISPTGEMTLPIQVRVTDPNPDPSYLKIITSSIGGGAQYTSTIGGTGPEGIVWEGVLVPGSLPLPIAFQVQVTGIPTTALAAGHLVTNTATIADVNEPGSLPNVPDAKAPIRIMPQRIFLPLVLKNFGG